MNGLRALAVATALVIGIGGAGVALSSMPVTQLTQSNWGPLPGYMIDRLLWEVVAPLIAAVAFGTALLLLARLDRRLEQLQKAMEEADGTRRS